MINGLMVEAKKDASLLIDEEYLRNLGYNDTCTCGWRVPIS